MRIQLFLAAAFAITTPIYGRALSNTTQHNERSLSQTDLRSIDRISNNVLPRAPAKKALAKMALGKSKVGKGKPDPKAPKTWKKSAAWFKKHPGGDNVVLDGTVIPNNAKVRRAVSISTVAPGGQLGSVRRSTIWLPVWVAIYEGGGAFKHWALFVDNEADTSKSFIVHVQGSAGNFRYEQRVSNAHQSPKLVELIQVGHVDSTKVKELRAIAKKVTIKNTDLTWNCQDFVFQLIGDLAVEDILDAEDEIYTKGKEDLFSRMEGLA